jgi:hypothetical protein
MEQTDVAYAIRLPANETEDSGSYVKSNILRRIQWLEKLAESTPA